MHTVRRATLYSLLTLGIIAVAVLHGAAGVPSLAALGDLRSISTPTYVYAGVPFMVQDSYATQLCVSSRSGWFLPPFVVSGARFGGTPTGSPSEVRAYVPFMVHDHGGTQVCVSTRSGQLLPPPVVPIRRISSALARVSRSIVSTSFLSTLIAQYRSHQVP